ncbi:YfhO family protein [Candidatus Gottesmanbacteria bacterium]|nr:YfhO family protein [Candidatus Gottesmanbacteria bacterium]
MFFFSRLFYPQLSIFATHEIGINDIWHLNYPLKNYLHERLSQNKIPLWNDMIAGGFPTLAEGEAGVFNVFNLLLYKFFPTIIAFNLSYVLAFLMSSIGMYFFAKRLKFSPLYAFYISILYGYSGYFVAHISNLVNLQASSYLPWVLLFTDLMLSGSGAVGALALSLTVSQLIFTGFPQMTFIALSFALLYIAFVYIKKKTSLKRIIIWIGVVIYGFILSAVQLLPTYELTSLSPRSQGAAYQELLFYKFPIEHFITFIDQFHFGNPQKGTYPHFNAFNGSIFWENSGYIGILPLILLLLSLTRLRKFDRGIFFVSSMILSALLMIGGSGPLYILLTLPPFSYFRFPSRYLILFLFSLSILAGFGLKIVFRFWNKNKVVAYVIVVCILIYSFGDIVFHWYTYHPVVSYKLFSKTPDIVSYLNNIPHGRIYSFSGNARTFDEFSHPYPGKIARYLDLQNDLIPNSQETYHLSSPIYYATLYPKRLGYIQSLFGNEYVLEATAHARLTREALRILSIRNVTHVLSPQKLINQELRQISVLSLPSIRTNNRLYVYENTASLPKYSLYQAYKYVTTVEEFVDYIKSDSFDYKTAIVETEIPSDTALPLQYSITKEKEEPEETQLSVEVNQEALLSIANTYYPGWNAYIDMKKTKVIPVNLVNQGIVVPAGKHQVLLTFEPKSYSYGLMISLVSYSFFTVSLVRFLFKRYHKLSVT